jgi:hypothetical protein
MIERHRYLAACAAVQAGTGKGEDGGKLNVQERAAWRKQALNWLQADLKFWGQAAHSGPPRAKQTVQFILRAWLTEADLQAVREPTALAGLPLEERDEWQQLWGDVEGLIKKTGAKAETGK